MKRKQSFYWQKKWKLTNLVERQVKDPFAITCPNGKKNNVSFKKTKR